MGAGAGRLPWLGHRPETPPVSSITSVTYTDTSGADVVLDSGDYTLDTVTDQGRSWLLPSATLGAVEHL